MPKLYHVLGNEVRSLPISIQEKHKSPQLHPLWQDSGSGPCLLQLADQFVLIFDQPCAVHLLGIEHFPQLLRDFPLLALLPLDGDLIKFVLAGLDLVLQLFKSANK